MRKSRVSLSHLFRRCGGSPNLSMGQLPFTPLVSRAMVHERPFLELSEDASKGEAYNAARDALLQLNVMVRKGIEPDALMYTSLISKMGRAGLEWQAYKLFSRMVEQDVRPLPETYVALYEATSKSRRSLREQIQSKIAETVDIFPEQVAQDEIARQKEEDRLCIAKFNEYLRGELPPVSSDELTHPTSSTEDPHDGSSEFPKKETSPNQPVATMRIRNPTDVWNTAQHAEEIRGAPHRLASEESAKSLREQLDRLDEEELRIYLAAQRQLRHGNKEQLIERIVSNVNEASIREMLNRRSHYFRSVEQILANDLRQLNMDGPLPPGRMAREKDSTLTKGEKETSSPEVLHAPWGILRKPRRREADLPAPRNADRLEQLALSEPELLLVREKAATKDLDEIPESLLRRYCYQFRLRWRRKDPSSILDAVQWHSTTFFDVTEEGKLLPRSPHPTPAVRLQQEDEGMQQTLENFEAFRIISQRTNNLQVVDNKEINLYLKRIRRESASRENKLEQSLRRERNMMAAASLASSAMEYVPPPSAEGEEDTVDHVLGWQEDAKRLQASTNLTEEEEEKGPYDGAYSSQDMPSELPPWELFGGQEEFHLDTGHFGDPETGAYQELSDSRFKVLPSREAQKRWEVDDNLLPSGLQDVVQKAILERKKRHESIEKEYQQKLNYKRYKKWDQFLQKAQQRQRESNEQREEEDNVVRPLPAQKRMAQLLRQGSHKQKVSEALRAKFSKEL